MKYAELEETLCRLNSVDAVRVIGENGNIAEVHVLASPGKPAKQVVRDVQSLAMASFGVTVDRRVVSVVQIENEEIGRSDRPAVVEISEAPEGARSTVNVTLAWKNELFIGEGNRPSWRHRPPSHDRRSHARRHGIRHRRGHRIRPWRS